MILSVIKLDGILLVFSIIVISGIMVSLVIGKDVSFNLLYDFVIVLKFIIISVLSIDML